MAADAVKSVPGSQGTPAMKLTSVTPTKGCTVTTQQTGLGTRPEARPLGFFLGPASWFSLEALWVLGSH